MGRFMGSEVADTNKLSPRAEGRGLFVMRIVTVSQKIFPASLSSLRHG